MRTKSLMTLRREAGSSCYYRGHKMRWTLWHGESTSIWTGLCVKKGCEGWAQVSSSPPPNGINIGGPAVAINCPYKEEKL